MPRNLNKTCQSLIFWNVDVYIVGQNIRRISTALVTQFAWNVSQEFFRLLVCLHIHLLRKMQVIESPIKYLVNLSKVPVKRLFTSTGGQKDYLTFATIHCFTLICILKHFPYWLTLNKLSPISWICFVFFLHFWTLFSSSSSSLSSLACSSHGSVFCEGRKETIVCVCGRNL